MSLGLNDANALKSVTMGDEVRISAFSQSGKKIVEDLVMNGIFSLESITRASKSVKLVNPKAFLNYMSSRLGIPDLDAYIMALGILDPTRAELASIGVSTKLRSVNPKSGYHINTPDGIDVTVNGKSLNINLPHGCALFVYGGSKLDIPSDVVIVGVENFENITSSFDRETLFEGYKKILLIERSRHLQNLLGNITNKYVHFGDIDLAGVHIYQSEYEPIVQERGKFMIPKNINEVIAKYGIKSLYEQQIERFKNLVGSNQQRQNLIDIIHKHKKGLEQEYYCGQRR